MNQQAVSPRVADVRVAVRSTSDNLAFRHLAWPKCVRASDGSIVLAYLGGEVHGGRKGLYVHTSTDDGATFSPARLLWWGDETYPKLGNCALGVTVSGAAVLLAMAHNGTSPNVVSTIRGWRSTDDGATFQPVDTSRLDGTVRSVFGRVLSLPDNRLMVMGFNTEQSKGMDETALWRAYSTDDGMSWGDPKLVTGGRTPMVEPSVIGFEGRIMGVGRHRPPGDARPDEFPSPAFLWHIESADGETFSARPTPMRVGRLGAPYITEVGGVLYALLTDRDASDAKGDAVCTLSLWKYAGDDWERVEDLLIVPNVQQGTRVDFGYPWGVRIGDGEERIYYYLGFSKGRSDICSFRLKY